MPPSKSSPHTGRRDNKITTITRTITIGASAEATWQVLGDFSAACDVLALVVACQVEGVGVGARRTLTGADGSMIVERLETLEHDSRRLSYRLLSDTPFRACLTTLSVLARGPGQSEVEWSATFDADGIPESEAAELMAGALAANCLAVKRFLER